MRDSRWSRPRIALAMLGIILAAHGTPAPAAAVREPEGFWTGPINSAVPRKITGGTIIHARELAQMLKNGRAVIVDVANAPRRPQNMSPATWLPVPHRAIPGSLWIPGAGLGEPPPPVDKYFRDRLATATGNDFGRPVVIYCHERCWLSWNGAKRAMSYGYRKVYWFPDGIEGWKAARLPTVVIEPEATP